eukprot:12906054-Prorocentrum_lima.AAC.1
MPLAPQQHACKLSLSTSVPLVAAPAFLVAPATIMQDACKLVPALRRGRKVEKGKSTVSIPLGAP